jgi:hypothetical protein
MLIESTFVNPIPILEHAIIDVGHEQATNNRTNQVEEKICSIFEEIGTGKQHSIENPCQRFVDYGDCRSYQQPIDKVSAKGLDLGFMDEEIKDSQNNHCKYIDLELNQVTHPQPSMEDSLTYVLCILQRSSIA